MRTIALLLSILFPSLLGAATYPNYFVTNATPFSVVEDASMYVPTMYSTNMLTTNLTVTDYLFIGTAQINYLNALGTVTASNFVGSAAGLTNLTSTTISGIIPSKSIAPTNSVPDGALLNYRGATNMWSGALTHIDGLTTWTNPGAATSVRINTNGTIQTVGSAGNITAGGYFSGTLRGSVLLSVGADVGITRVSAGVARTHTASASVLGDHQMNSLMASNAVIYATLLPPLLTNVNAGAQIWSDGTNLCVTLINAGGVLTTNKITMSAYP